MLHTIVPINNICLRCICANTNEKSSSEYINISHLKHKPFGDEALTEIQGSNKKTVVVEVSIGHILAICI